MRPDHSKENERKRLLQEADSFYEEGYYGWAFARYLKLEEDYQYLFDNARLKKIIKCSSVLPVQNFRSFLQSFKSLIKRHYHLLNEKDTKNLKEIFTRHDLDTLEESKQPQIEELLQEANSLGNQGAYDKAFNKYMEIWKTYNPAFDHYTLNRIFFLASTLSSECLKEHIMNLRTLFEANPHLLDDQQVRKIIKKVPIEIDIEKSRKSPAFEKRVKGEEKNEEVRGILREPENQLKKQDDKAEKENQEKSTTHAAVGSEGYKYSILLAKLYHKKGDNDNEVAQWEKLYSIVEQFPEMVKNQILENLTNLYLRLPLNKFAEKQMEFLCERLRHGQTAPSFQEKIEDKIVERVENYSTIDERISWAQTTWSWCDKNNKKLELLCARLFRKRNQKRKDEIDILKKTLLWDKEKESKIYLSEAYQANQMLEEASDVLEELRSEYPNDKDIGGKCREVHCELSKKLVREGKYFMCSKTDLS
jgi:hypothetical protein